MTLVVELHGVSFSYGHHIVLRQVDLCVERGEFLGLVGPNGGGKTTLVKVILGLLTPQEGEVLLFGVPAYALRERWRIGYVSQHATHFDQQFPTTVREAVATGRYGRLGLFRRMGKRDWEAVDRAIAAVGLTDVQHRLLGKLSGGQQQRAFIARALAGEPELLVLDEPTVGVDAAVAGAFYQLMTELHRDYNLTIIMVSHDVGVIARQVTKVACINGGVTHHGCPQEILNTASFSSLYDAPVKLLLHDHE